MSLSRQFSAFVMVGLVAAVAHYGLLIALVEGAGWAAVPATLAGYVAGGIVSYLLNRRHTYASDRPHEEAGWPRRLSRPESCWSGASWRTGSGPSARPLNTALASEAPLRATAGDHPERRTIRSAMKSGDIRAASDCPWRGSPPMAFPAQDQ